MLTFDKVTAFVTRPHGAGHDLLLFEHPNAGIQLPAGSVEEGEDPQNAVVREVAEETGLTAVTVRQDLGCHEEHFPPETRVLAHATTVYARPDPASFDWIHMPRGAQVEVLRREGGYSQIRYIEPDKLPDPTYETMHLVGWAPDDALAAVRRRYFYHLTSDADTPDRWSIFADHHTFTPFWAPLDALPQLIWPQSEWLAYLDGVT